MSDLQVKASNYLRVDVCDNRTPTTQRHEASSEGSKNEISLHKHIENHCSMDCDWRINSIEFFRQYRAMIAAVNTLTEFLLSIHYDPCNESLAEPKIDHMEMTTAEALSCCCL